jgi:hypothetical protein
VGEREAQDERVVTCGSVFALWRRRAVGVITIQIVIIAAVGRGKGIRNIRRRSGTDVPNEERCVKRQTGPPVRGDFGARGVNVLSHGQRRRDGWWESRKQLEGRLGNSCGEQRRRRVALGRKRSLGPVGIA